MSKAKLNETLAVFSGAVTVMSFDSDQPEDESSETRQEQRDRCALKFAAVRENWDKDPRLLAKLEELTSEGIAAYAAGEFDKGDKAVMGIDEILWSLRE